jgi:NitT/TauT family transport system ATP-binding protein
MLTETRQELGAARPQVRVEFDSVTKVFRQRDQQVVAVRDMSFTLHDREFVSILGPSGCGKSTTLKLISGLDFPAAGSVRLDGAPVKGPSPKVGFMLQKDLLLPWRTILENVTIGLETQGMPRAERNDRARSLIAKYGLRAICRAACASAWRSRARWPPTRRSCCSTSRCPRSTTRPS